MARLLMCVAVLCTALLIVRQGADDGMPSAAAAPLVKQQPPSEVPGFMRKKLEMVSTIVEGMATDDFEMVDQGGRQLAELAESAAWAADRDPFYRHYSNSFEQAVRGLITAAKSESIEKVTYAYVHVTFSCTACHQHIRNVDRVAGRVSAGRRVH